MVSVAVAGVLLPVPQICIAMRRRNYAHLELKALRTHLDEHANQDRTYGNSDWIAEEKVSSADEKRSNKISCIDVR